MGDFINLRLKLKKSVCFSVFISVFFYKENYLFIAYGAAIIHECAHGCAAYLLGITSMEIKLGMLGANLVLPQVISSKDKIIIYTAGPLASFILWGYLFAAENLLSTNSAALAFFTFTNFVIGVVNLLPVFPLDGGVILKSVFAKYIGVINGAKKCRLVSSGLLYLTGFLAVILLYCGILNPSIWGVFLFLLLNRSKERYHSIAEKKTVLSGEIVSKTKLKYMACDGESELLCLAEYISYDYTLIVAVFCKGKFIGDLNQYDITRGIQKYGALCRVKDCINKTMG